MRGPSLRAAFPAAVPPGGLRRACRAAACSPYPPEAGAQPAQQVRFILAEFDARDADPLEAVRLAPAGDVARRAAKSDVSSRHRRCVVRCRSTAQPRPHAAPGDFEVCRTVRYTRRMNESARANNCTPPSRCVALTAIAIDRLRRRLRPDAAAAAAYASSWRCWPEARFMLLAGNGKHLAAMRSCSAASPCATDFDVEAVALSGYSRGDAQRARRLRRSRGPPARGRYGASSGWRDSASTAVRHRPGSRRPRRHRRCYLIGRPDERLPLDARARSSFRPRCGSRRT